MLSESNSAFSHRLLLWLHIRVCLLLSPWNCKGGVPLLINQGGTECLWPYPTISADSRTIDLPENSSPPCTRVQISASHFLVYKILDLSEGLSCIFGMVSK